MDWSPTASSGGVWCGIGEEPATFSEPSNISRPLIGGKNRGGLLSKTNASVAKERIARMISGGHLRTVLVASC